MLARPTPARSSRPTRLSTNWRRLREGRCRCSSRPRITPGWCTFGLRSVRRRELALPFEDYAHASEQALHHARLAGQRNSHLFRLESALATGRGRQTRRYERSTRSSPRTRIPGCCWRAPGCSRCSPALRRQRRLRARPANGGASSRAMTGSIRARHDRGDRRRPRERSRALGRFCELVEARGQRYSSRPSRRSLAARSARLAATTRPSCSPSSAASSTRRRKTSSTQALWRQVQARVYASRGQHAEAETLAREAVAITDAPTR